LIQQKELLQDDSVATKYTNFINQYIIENMQENIKTENIKTYLIN
jgi:hypothetical protein